MVSSYDVPDRQLEPPDPPKPEAPKAMCPFCLADLILVRADEIYAKNHERGHVVKDSAGRSIWIYQCMEISDNLGVLGLFSAYDAINRAELHVENNPTEYAVER